MNALTKIPATIVTGFLGAGKTSLVRHVLERAGGVRLAVIVNEFGSLGVDGETLRSCGIETCPDENIVELSNGCLCCTVADDFLPTMQALVDRASPPDHILIETSGLALPKPLLKAFDWPSVRARATVDGVVTVVDSPAVAAGRFADDPIAVQRQRAEDPAVEHDNPLAEVFADQLNAADLVVLNKTDMIGGDALDGLRQQLSRQIPRAVKIVTAQDGKVDPRVLLGIGARAEDDLATRPSHHDALDGAHEHDDFTSFVVPLREMRTPEEMIARLRDAAERHDILRMKGFVAIAGKPARLAVQGVGARFRHQFDLPWPATQRDGHMVVIARTGIDQAAVERALRD